MFQIKDYQLIIKMMLLPIFIIIICFVLGSELPQENRINILNTIFNSLKIGLPIIGLLSIIYIILIIKNYKDGTIINKNDRTMEYSSIFNRKTINISDYTHRAINKDGMFYNISFTGDGKPIVLKASSDLICNDISSKMSIIKDL